MLNIAQTTISLAAVFGIFQLFRIRNRAAFLITLFQIISIAISILTGPPVEKYGFYLFDTLILVATIYIISQSIMLRLKIQLLLISVPVFLSMSFKLFQWPYSYEWSILMFIPVLTYITVLFQRKEMKHELGIVTIITTEAAIELLSVFANWFNL